MAEEESGIDELMRLSQQFTRQQEEHDEQKRQREEQSKKVRGVLQGLKELNLSMAIDQLKPFAETRIIKQVEALRSKDDTDDLRKMISSLAEDLEKNMSTTTALYPETATLMNSIRTLNILMDLYFSLH